MSTPLDAVVVKLGGSVITDKDDDTPRVRAEVLQRLARELAQTRPRRLVLVHGAGSFGHRIAQRTGLHQGLDGPDRLQAWAQTAWLQQVLSAEVCEALLDAELPAVACQASASAVLAGGALQRMDVEVARHIIDAGGVPVFGGVPAVDLRQGCGILSGDQIAPYLALALGIRQVIHGTDVDGVFRGDPKRGAAEHVPHVHRGNWQQVAAGLGGAASVDVTGGMRGKVESLLEWARQGVRARIVDATRPGRLTAALAGEAVGTAVSWEEEA